jgi:hypothetical protein
MLTLPVSPCKPKTGKKIICGNDKSPLISKIINF